MYPWSYPITVNFIWISNEMRIEQVSLGTIQIEGESSENGHTVNITYTVRIVNLG